MWHQHFDSVPLRVALQRDAPVSFVSSGVCSVWHLVAQQPELNAAHPCMNQFAAWRNTNLGMCGLWPELISTTSEASIAARG
jgi:hypothetical protein